MNEIVFDAVNLLVAVAAFAFTAFLIPWMRRSIGADRMKMIAGFAKKCVLAAQQVYWAKTGEEKKARVRSWIYNYCAEHHITITEEQVGILIESAVKEMKLAGEGQSNE